MPVAPTNPQPTQGKLVLALLLVLVTLAIYNPVARNGFVKFDDDRYVTDNPHVQAGLRWTTLTYAFTTFDLANWHPLTWLSYALDYQLFRLNPAGYHYTNLLLHTANALLLFLILQWFTGYTARSLMVAALFAVHPLNVESVAWIAERKNVLCMFFLLLAIAAYGWYVRSPGIPRYLAVAVLFTLSLMAKPMSITLPLLLLLLDYWPLRRLREKCQPARSHVGTDAPVCPAEQSSAPAGNQENAAFSNSTHSLWQLFREKLPLLALSLASAIITIYAQRSAGAVLTRAAHSPILRLKNVIVCYALYIQKTIWPSHLAALYPYPRPRDLPLRLVAVSALILIAITAAVIKYRRHRYIAVGWLWYLGSMVPMIGLIQVGNQAMADRYAYLPVIGLFIMIVWSAADCAHSLSARSAPPNSLAIKLLATAAVVIVLALSAVTRSQITYWHDDFTLWSHALAVTRKNYVAENNFANALTSQGRYDEAIIHFRAAAGLEPGDPVSQLNLGIYAQEHADPQQAIARYEAVLQLAKDRQIRASAYANLGTVYFALHDYPRAQHNFDSAMQLQVIFPAVLLDMGLIEQKSAEKTTEETTEEKDVQKIAQKNDNWNRAADYFAHYAALEPSDVAYLLLANALQHAGRPDDAAAANQQAQRLSTDIARARKRAAELSKQ
ncbi:MAG TPA: tetratricopeptide repeat protein [Terriglobales bacterium]|jgi:tetratricopeptide (TPR) repeat protein|nr:tetratricopeptide repeat protein [Terriglobales bacterium]